MSPWYHARPKGAFGIWITKKSNSVFGGSPLTCTSMCSTGPFDSILTRAVASCRQLPFVAAAERTMSNSMCFSPAVTVPAPATGNRAASAMSPTRPSLLRQLSMKIPLCEETAFDARAKPVESGGRRRRTKKEREIRGRRRERDPNRAVASPSGGRVDAGYQEWGDDENAGELFRIGNAVEGDQ